MTKKAELAAMQGYEREQPRKPATVIRNAAP
jgi:hypothetical protein